MAKDDQKSAERAWRPETALVHGGTARSQWNETAEALFLTQGYVYDTAEQAEARFNGQSPGHQYTRYSNPTISMFEDRLKLFEGAEECRATSGCFTSDCGQPQLLALATGTLAVLILIFAGGHFPWIALSLAMSFAIYGVIRKTTPVNSVVGVATETLLLLPIALVYWAFTSMGRRDALASRLAHEAAHVGERRHYTVPLLCFGQAARSVPLSMLGFMQFIAPSMQFVLAVTHPRRAAQHGETREFYLHLDRAGDLLDRRLARRRARSSQDRRIRARTSRRKPRRRKRESLLNFACNCFRSACSPKLKVEITPGALIHVFPGSPVHAPRPAQ